MKVPASIREQTLRDMAEDADERQAMLAEAGISSEELDEA